MTAVPITIGRYTFPSNEERAKDYRKRLSVSRAIPEAPTRVVGFHHYEGFREWCQWLISRRTVIAEG